MSSAEIKGKKSIPLRFDDFYESLTQLVTKALETRKTGPLLKFLKHKTGFALSDLQVRSVLELIRRLPNWEVIEFSIVLEYRLNRSQSRIISALGSEISRGYFQCTGFDDLLANATNQSLTLQQIESWIRHSLVASSGEIGKDPKVVASRHKEVFGCLLTQIESPYFVAAVMCLLEAYVDAGSQYQSDPKKSVRKFASNAGTLFKPGKSARSRILLMVETRSILDEETRRLRQLLSTAQERAVDLEETSRAQAAMLHENERQLKAADQTIANLQGKVTEQQQNLEVANARAAAIENHLNETHRQEVNGMIYKLRQQMENELTEIQFCLEGNNPNSSMALGRVLRLLESARNLKGIS